MKTLLLRGAKSGRVKRVYIFTNPRCAYTWWFYTKVKFTRSLTDPNWWYDWASADEWEDITPKGDKP